MGTKARGWCKYPIPSCPVKPKNKLAFVLSSVCLKDRGIAEGNAGPEGLVLPSCRMGTGE